jgi:ech hydrogenase subunit A
MYYKVLSGVFCTTSTILSVILAIQGPQRVLLSGSLYHTDESVIFLFEVLIIIYLYWISIRNHRWAVLGLTVISTLLSIYSTFFSRSESEAILNISKLSIVMALIVNIIGTLIILFANEYMGHYEEHRHMKSRQKLFYFVICIFLSAMNGLLFSDSMKWVYFFWEITTLISFVLISYNNDTEALNSGFRALTLNLIGGVCFLMGIILFDRFMNISSLSQV